MAKLIIGFDEFGGIGEYNGMPLYKSEPLIINKATDFITEEHLINESLVKWALCDVDYAARNVDLILEI